VVAAARAAGEDVDASLELAETYGICLPVPGGGATLWRWQLFADVAAQDLTVARILEAHADALAILAEAGVAPPTGRWGVFAAEAPGVELTGRRLGAGWVVEGTKPWCSLGGRLDHALVTARVGAGRQLFAVDLVHQSVRPEPASGWVARGLRAIPSGLGPFRPSASTPRSAGRAGIWTARASRGAGSGSPLAGTAARGRWLSGYVAVPRSARVTSSR